LIPKVKDFPFGHAFNVGGGPKNTLSILELFSLLELNTGLSAKFENGNERPGDQKYYVSNIDKINRATGWSPTINVFDGVLKVFEDRRSTQF
jgi:CDP-paratose 2-epimerase